MKAIAYYIDGSKRVYHGGDGHAWAHEQSWNSQVLYAEVKWEDVGFEHNIMYTYYKDGEEVDGPNG